MVDLSTATNMTDMANRILRSATEVMGRRWKDYLGDLIRLLKVTVTMQYDPVTQMSVPSLETGAREDTFAAQQNNLATVLDTLDAMAADRHVTLGIVLDEFQEIARFGSARGGTPTVERGGRSRASATQERASSQSQPEWHLRGAMQRHQHLSYILAGSQQSLLDSMVAPRAAFYKILTPVAFRPIDAGHMADWIDQRLISIGLTSEEAGSRCVELAGPRTRDIVRLARKCVDITPSHERVDGTVLTAALLEVTDEEDDGFVMRWSKWTALQQNVLRAIAATSDGLTSQRVRKAFNLGSSGTVSNAARSLLDDGVFVRTTHGAGYVFDDPYLRSWVIRRALADIGLTLPITHIANRTGEYD